MFLKFHFFWLGDEEFALLLLDPPGDFTSSSADSASSGGKEGP